MKKHLETTGDCAKGTRMIDLDQKMEQEGYIIGTPEGLETFDQGIEAQLCANYTCEICSHVGLRHRQFVEQRTQACRAFAECPKCGWAEEL